MLIQARQISKCYQSGQVTVTALLPTSLTILEGEFVAILGPSGSGKSTLMNIIGLLDRPTTGEFLLDGYHCAELDDDAIARLRNRHIGFVFQSYHLLPRQTILGNVELPLLYAGVRKAERRMRAGRVLEAVHLSHRADHLPSQLSGGEQQRVAIARAIVTDPAVILADEPTGALDSVSGSEVMKILTTLNCSGRTVVLVTHDLRVAHYAARVVHIRDGRVLSDEPAVPVRSEAEAREACSDAAA